MSMISEQSKFNKDKLFDLITKISETIEEDVNDLKLDYVLTANGLWDSIAAIVTITSIDEIFGVLIEPKNLRNCSTIRDILDLINNELKKLIAN